MNSAPEAGPSPTFTARVLYGALFAGTLVATAVLVILRTRIGAEVATLGATARTVLRGLVLTLAAGGTIGLRAIRAGLPPLPAPSALDAWWQANLGRVVALWAFPDGIGIAGAVAHFLSGDLLVLALAGGWALAMFVTYAPHRLTGG